VDSLALVTAATALLALCLGAVALLRAWAGWLDLRRLRLDAGSERSSSPEVFELRQRVRKLERIALGLD
jgi:hypothetical protein